MKEIAKVFTKLVIQGMLEWKFPIFLGALLTLNAIFLFVSEALREYNDWAAVPTVTVVKICLGAASAGIGALIGFLSTTVSRTRDEIKANKQNEKANGSNSSTPSSTST